MIGITYRDRFDIVFGDSGNPKPNTRKGKVELLAQIIYACDRSRDKEDCLVQALEEYECMTGRFWDPTKAEYDDMLASII